MVQNRLRCARPPMTSPAIANPSPSVEDVIDEIVAGLRSSCTYAGARPLEEFHDRATVGIQSTAGFAEGRPLHTSW